MLFYEHTTRGCGIRCCVAHSCFSCLVVQTAKDRWREGFGTFFESFSRLTRAKPLLLCPSTNCVKIAKLETRSAAHATHQYLHDPIQTDKNKCRQPIDRPLLDCSGPDADQDGAIEEPLTLFLSRWLITCTVDYYAVSISHL